jgi:RNA polymerase sigma-B factor
VSADGRVRTAANEPDPAELFARRSDPAARDELARMFLPLAEHLARRFAGRGESVDDLVQVASLGLVQAIDRFDPTREVQFSTFATVTIVGELKRHFRDRGWSIRVPRNLQETTLVVNRTIGDLWQELGRAPTAEDVAERANLSIDQVLDAMEAANAYAASSLDTSIDAEGVSIAETMGAPDPAMEVSEAWMTVEPRIRELPPREQRILVLRFFRGMTQAEIAEEVGISQMHVSRLLSRTLRVLRTRGDSEEPGPEGPGSSPPPHHSNGGSEGTDLAGSEDADPAGADQ